LFPISPLQCFQRHLSKFSFVLNSYRICHSYGFFLFLRIVLHFLFQRRH
jgi:hypothetical protein